MTTNPVCCQVFYLRIFTACVAEIELLTKVTGYLRQFVRLSADRELLIEIRDKLLSLNFVSKIAYVQKIFIEIRDKLLSLNFVSKNEIFY